MLKRILLSILLLCSLCMFILCLSEFLFEAIANESVWRILSGGLLSIFWGRIAYFVNEKIEDIYTVEEELTFTWSDEEEE